MVVPCAADLRADLLRARHLWRHRLERADARQFPPRRRPALSLDLPRQRASLALIATLIALLIGYPAAYAIAKAPPTLADVAAVPRHPAVLDELPDPHLCLDRAAQSGGPDQRRADRQRASSASRCRCSTTKFAVVLGLVYNYTPFVILAIYSALQRLDPSYAEASRDLGAGAVHDLPAHHPAAHRTRRGGGRGLRLRACRSAIS